jgi:hypothetical protein
MPAAVWDTVTKSAPEYWLGVGLLPRTTVPVPEAPTVYGTDTVTD